MSKEKITDLMVFPVSVLNVVACGAVLWKIATIPSSTSFGIVVVCLPLLFFFVSSSFRSLQTKHDKKIYFFPTSFAAIGGALGGTIAHNDLLLRVGLAFFVPAIILTNALLRLVVQKK